MRITRRAFISSVAMAGAACARRESSAPPIAKPTLDFHVHLFGQGDGGTGCRFSATQRRHWNYPFFLRLLNLSENGRMDQDYVAELVRQLRASSTRRALLLAQDARYDARGHRDLDRTHVYVPNEYLFRSEHSSEVTDLAFTDPARLRLALEEGCTVVAAHSGMGSVLDQRPFRDDFLRNLSRLAGRFPRLYCDTSVLASMFRWRNIRQLLDEPALVDRAVYASDWPFTSNALVFWNRLGPARLLSMCAEKNLFERDYQLKRSLGLPGEAFERGAQLLLRERPRVVG